MFVKFSVKDKSGNILFCTDYASCVPLENLDSMNSSGLLFYIDDKKQSLSSVKSFFKNTEPVKVPKYRQFDAQLDFELDKIGPIEPEGVKLSKPISKKSKTISLIPNKPKNIDLTSVGFPITSRCIVCLNNSKVYRNQTEAAKDLKIDSSYISDCICHNKEYKGYKFKRAIDL